MRWSFKIGSLAGIPIRVHATFFLILLFVAFAHADNGPGAVARGMVFVLLLFLCVVLHELGHSLVGRRYGYRVRDITLLPIGGVASFEHMPTNPREELAIASAGPAVSFAIAGALYLVVTATGSFQPLTELDVDRGSLVERLMVVNFFLAAFNLLPAFPMDGGRMLRAFLAQRMEYTAATQIAARIGQGMALVFGFIGLFTNPFLLFIALFVYIGAEQEAAAATMRSVFQGVAVRDAMVTHFTTLAGGATVADALAKLLEGYQHDFPVLDARGHVMGMLTRAMLLEAVARGDERTSVGPLLRSEPGDIEQALTPDTPLDDGIERLRGRGATSLPILQGGRLVGLLTLENVGELVMIHNARARTHGASGVSPRTAAPRIA
jgi:Zn-dependent protease